MNENKLSERNRVVGVSFQDDARILTQEEIDFVESRILSAFRDQLSAENLFPTQFPHHLSQHRVTLNIDNWSNNAITSINNGRAELQSRGFIGVEPVLIASRRIARELDRLIANSNVSYRDFLLQNNLISAMYEVNLEDDSAILVVDAEVNAVIPIINRDFTLNWRELGKDNTPKFTEEVVDTAWFLLKEYMTEQQYSAFMEGNKIEVQNNDRNYRLIFDKKGEFMVLQEKAGSGIVSSLGRIKSYDYPLGDEIAAFLDWFKFKTEELISQRNCGTYGIVKEGQRR